MTEMSRRNFLKRTASTGAAILAGGVLAACGAPAAQSTSTDATTSTGPSTAPAQGPVTLTFWANFGANFTDATNKLQQDFEDSHPSITIERQDLGDWDEMREKTLTAFSAGTGPDVFRIAVFDTALYALRNTVVSLDDQLASFNLSKEVFVPGFLANVMYDGKMYALPWKGSAVAFYWNKRLFEEAGLDPETPPKTWDEVAEFAKQLTKPDKQQFGFQIQYTDEADGMNFFGPLLYSFQADLFNSLDPAAVTAAAFNTEQGIAALQWIQDMVASQAVNPPGITVEDEQINERVAMWVDGQWGVGTIGRRKPDLQYGTTVLPDSQFGKGTTVTGGDHLAISTVSKNPSQAMEFIAWANTPEVELEFFPIIGGLPGRNEATTDPTYAQPPFSAFTAQLEKGAKPRPGVPDIAEILHTIMAEVQLTEFGKQDAATSMANAEQKVNDILKKRQ